MQNTRHPVRVLVGNTITLLEIKAKEQRERKEIKEFVKVSRTFL